MNTTTDFIKSIVYLFLATTGILMIPLIAMQFSGGVNWTLSDFIFAGMLIFGTGLTYRIITWKSADRIYRIAVGFALFSGFFLIWSNLAVGIIGSEDNEFNLLYFLVIAVGIIGAFAARFKPTGLMYTLFSMAALQAVIAVAALFTGMAEIPGSSVYEILTVNGFFITLFLVAGLLFRNAESLNTVSKESIKE